MKALARSMTIAAALTITGQPCAAAAAGSNTALAGQSINFRLAHQPGPASMASMSLAASQQTASETDEQPRRKGPGTTTLLVVGGVILLVVLIAATTSVRGPGPEND